jgi:Fe-S cluster biogenesis protein NfuA
MSDLRERVQAALTDHVAPVMGLDPAELTAVAVEDGIASLRLAGACASCPAGLPALLTELEGELRKHVPEVEFVEAVL